MTRLLLCVVALAAMFGTGARAQDLAGNWQGTLKAGKDLRVIRPREKESVLSTSKGWREMRSDRTVNVICGPAAYERLERISRF